MPHRSTISPGLPAITLHQPWASLIHAKAKRYETRGWEPYPWLVGSRLAIHASRTPIPSLDGQTSSAMEVALGLPQSRWGLLPVGVVLCTAVLEGAYRVGEGQWQNGRLPIVQVVPGSMALDSIELLQNELYFGNYLPGRWLWRLVDIKPLRSPAPAIGRQRLWYWAPDETPATCPWIGSAVKPRRSPSSRA